MRSKVFLGLTVVLAGTAAAQSPAPLRLPVLRGDRTVQVQTPAAAALDEAASLYQSRHEAAVAALKAANQAAATNRTDRAIGFFLVAVRRDPKYGKPVYNLGIMCARGERWEDAISFYKEAALVEPNAEMVRLTAGELERVRNLAALDATAEGKRRRQFDIGFMEVLKLAKGDDSVKTLDSLNELTKGDTSRWEGLAMRGMLEASLGHYAEASRALDGAARLAPVNRRQALTASAEISRSEAQYEDVVGNADRAWEKQEYEPAAKMYATAWGISPGRGAIGMQAATGFLMADKISLAVQILARLRQTGSPEYSQKATAMLKELGAVSKEGLRAASSERSGVADAPISDLGGHIRSLLGDLTSPQMKLTTKPPPPMLEDNTPFIEIKDAELTGSGALLMSTESVFAQYQKIVPPAAELPTETPTEIITTTPPPPDPVSTRPPRLNPRPEPQSMPDRAAMGGGASNVVSITSVPAGAGVVFDNDPSVTCTTPCLTPLAAGRHTFKATLEGYRDVLKIVVLEKNTFVPPIDLAFEIKQGQVSVEARAGLPIYLDGKKTGQMTPARLLVNEGEHEIGIEFEGNLVKQAIKVKDGGRLTISL